MSEIGPIRPTYALAVPMQIGDVEAMTLAMNLSEVVFDAPVAFAVGGAIDFSVVIGLADGPVQLDCHGAVVSCSERADGRFQAGATIETFQIVPRVPLGNPDPGQMRNDSGGTTL